MTYFPSFFHLFNSVNDVFCTLAELSNIHPSTIEKSYLILCFALLLVKNLLFNKKTYSFCVRFIDFLLTLQNKYGYMVVILSGNFNANSECDFKS